MTVLTLHSEGAISAQVLDDWRAGSRGRAGVVLVSTGVAVVLSVLVSQGLALAPSAVAEVVLWAAVLAAVCLSLVAWLCWTEDTLRRALHLIAAGLALGTVPGVSRSPDTTPDSGHRPRRVLAGSLDTLAPPRSSSTSAGRGLSTYGPEGVPPP